jgi:hypothetical protein
MMRFGNGWSPGFFSQFCNEATLAITNKEMNKNLATGEKGK